MNSLQEWVAAQLSTLFALAESDFSLELLSGDASFRKYYRCELNQMIGGRRSLVVVDAPPDKEKNPEFVNVACYLQSLDVMVPQVLAQDYDKGHLLLSDLGDQLLLPLLNAETVDNYYQQAMDMLAQIQAADPLNRLVLEDYSDALLRQEMQLFPEWFVEKLLGVPISAAERQLIEESFDFLVAQVLSQPKVFVHRDFHSRNLMFVDSDSDAARLATIDFQDAVLGPISYDLVSLLRDCYIVWPSSRVAAWLDDYFERVKTLPSMEGVSAEEFRQWFDVMGLQRHIKVLGIFARLFIRDGKSGYLEDLPTVIHYTLSISQQYSQLSNFVQWFESRLLPEIKQQGWSSAPIHWGQQA